MAQDTTPALILYVGDGSQTRFEVPFDKGAYGEIKVAFVRRGLTDYTYNPDTYTVDGYLYAWNGGVYTKTEAVDTDTPLYDKNGEATGDTWTAEMYREPKNDIFTQAVVEWTGDALTTNDVICIVRDTVKDQPYSYPNNQKHIERALDNLARQIQELQLTADNALKVDPSWNYTMDDENKMDPITWLQTIVRSKDQTLREVRVDNDYIMYSTDDPDAEAKTWNVLAGVKTGNAGVVSHIRETKVLAEDGVTYIPFLEYSVDGGNSWKSAGQAASALEYQYVRKSGDTMTGTLWFQMASTIYKVGISVYDRHSMRFASATYGNGSFTMDFQNATLKPQLTDYAHIGTSSLRWADAYINKVYTGVINNGYDIAVPVTSEPDIFALKSDISAAINAGKMITEQGFWYAKMDSATVPPTAEDGTNYADFSQVDGQGNPIIVTYTRVNGAWVQDQTIVPPADEDGYVLITSKIWDIPEQTGQQGGKVLWNHVSKQFTPYPTIISFDNINVTGNSNVIMPQNPGNNQIVNKNYVDNLVSNTGTGRNIGDIFFTARTDNELNGAVQCDGTTYNTTDFTGAESIGALLEAGKLPYMSLSDYATALTANGSVGVFGWDGQGTTAFRVPSLNDIFIETGTAAQIGDYIAPGLPNITGYIGLWADEIISPQPSGAFALNRSKSARVYDGADRRTSTNGFDFDASRSSSVYGNSTAVQPNAVRYRAMVQLAVSATDEALETCTGVLADVAGLKSHEVIEFQAPTADNNYIWYRKYADGWVEQGQFAFSLTKNTTTAVTLPVEMADIQYGGQISCANTTYNTATTLSINKKSTTQVNLWGYTSSSDNTISVHWEVKGMMAESELSSYNSGSSAGIGGTGPEDE